MSKSAKNLPSLQYSWPPGSPLDRIEAHANAEGVYVCRLFPGREVDTAPLKNAGALLHRYGFSNAHEEVASDCTVLVVPGVRKLDKLMDVVREIGLVTGEPKVEEITSRSAEEPHKQGIDTVKWHGRVGTVGHTAILAAGLIQRPFDWGRIVNAPLGFANPLLMSALGSGKAYVDVPQMLRDMRQFFKEEGVELPRLPEEEVHKGLSQTLWHFLQAHPIEVGSSLGVIGSSAMIKSGMDGVRTGSSGWARIFLGSVNIVRDAIAVLVPERSKNAEKGPEEVTPEGKPRGVMGAAGYLVSHPQAIPGAMWRLLTGKPLLVVGGLSLVSDVGYAYDAFDAWNKNKKFREDSYVNDIRTKAGELQLASAHADIERQRVIERAGNPLAEAQPETRRMAELRLRARQIEEELRQQVTGRSGEAAWQKMKKINYAHPKTLSRLEGELKGMQINREMALSWRGKVTPWLGVTTALAFLGAGVLMMLSSKEHKQTDDEKELLFSRLCSVNAKVLAHVPEEQRESILKGMTHYLRTRKDISGQDFSPSRFEEEVRKRVKSVEQNGPSPWSDRVIAAHGMESGRPPAISM